MRTFEVCGQNEVASCYGSVDIIAIKGGVEYDKEGPSLSAHDPAYGSLRGRKVDLLYLAGLNAEQATNIGSLIFPMLKDGAKGKIVQEKDGSFTVQFNMEVKPTPKVCTETLCVMKGEHHT